MQTGLGAAVFLTKAPDFGLASLMMQSPSLESDRIETWGQRRITATKIFLAKGFRRPDDRCAVFALFHR